MGEPQPEQLCCCQCPGSCSQPLRVAKNLKLTLHPSPSARIRWEKNNNNTNALAPNKITSIFSISYYIPEHGWWVWQWQGHTCTWGIHLSLGKTSPLQQIPLLSLVNPATAWAQLLTALAHRVAQLKAPCPGSGEYPLHACRTNKAVKYTILEKKIEGMSTQKPVVY